MTNSTAESGNTLELVIMGDNRIGMDGMEELPELENNPPIGWVPSFIKERLS